MQLPKYVLVLVVPLMRFKEYLLEIKLSETTNCIAKNEVNVKVKTNIAIPPKSLMINCEKFNLAFVRFVVLLMILVLPQCEVLVERGPGWPQSCCDLVADLQSWKEGKTNPAKPSTYKNEIQETLNLSFCLNMASFWPICTKGANAWKSTPFIIGKEGKCVRPLG